MEIGAEEEGWASRTRRGRAQTAKTPEREKSMHHGRAAQISPLGTPTWMPNQSLRAAWDQDESNESGTEETVYVEAAAPGAPRPNRTVTMPQLETQMAPTKNRTSTEKANANANVQ